MDITVYTLPNCVQCNQTKRELDKAKIEYKVVDLISDEESYRMVTERLGYKSAPVVIVRDENGETVKHWSGFSPEHIRSF